MRRSSRTPYAAYEAFSDEEKQRRVRCGWCTRWRRHSVGSILIRRRSWWRSGGPPHPRASAGVDAPQRPQIAGARRIGGLRRRDGSRRGQALLADLLDRATQPDLVYSHRWSVGDTVIWDNNGVLHRAAPYDRDSPREMLHGRRFWATSRSGSLTLAAVHSALVDGDVPLWKPDTRI